MSWKSTWHEFALDYDGQNNLSYYNNAPQKN